jgi:hypothetical protein
MLLTLFIVADPFSMNLGQDMRVKHVPLVLALGGVMLGSVGNMLRASCLKQKTVSWQVLRTVYPLAMLGAWITIGGCYARFADQIQDSFLTAGAYILSTLVAARAVVLSAAHERLIAVVCRAIVIVAAFMIVRMIVQRGYSYHELEFLVIPVAVYIALRSSRQHDFRGTKVVFFLAGSIVFFKNTGFFVLLTTLAYLFWVEWHKYLRDSLRLYRYTALASASLAAVLAAFTLISPPPLEDVKMPSGNPGYRVRTYEKAINHFRESPIWGTSFVGRSTSRFTAYQISTGHGHLPTHSDVLDLAANGGVIALGLLVWGYVRVGRIALRSILAKGGGSDTTAAAHMFACMSLSGIAVYAFNPIMLQPPEALLLWSSLGMLVGCCLRQKSSPPREPRT